MKKFLSVILIFSILFILSLVILIGLASLFKEKEIYKYNIYSKENVGIHSLSVKIMLEKPVKKRNITILKETLYNALETIPYLKYNKVYILMYENEKDPSISDLTFEKEINQYKYTLCENKDKCKEVTE